MAVSLNLPSFPNLYCNEAASEIVSWEAVDDDDDDCEVVTKFASPESFNIDYDDESLRNMFDSEVDQMLEFKVLSRFYHLSDIVTARQEAIKWILKVNSYYRFRPETAYLSINYLDRFLSTRALPQGKGWPMQLLSVACISLAAKMEERSVPLLLDLQILKPRFLFKPKTVQRMEVLVMNTLKWRLRAITPFDFLHCFIARISCITNSQQYSLCHDLLSGASDLIIDTCKAIDSLDYPPSAIAAAVALWMTNHSLDDHNLGCLNDRINKEMARKIYNMIQRKMSISPYVKPQKLQPLPQSPTGVLDAANAMHGSCRLQKIGNNNTEFKQ